MHGSYKQLDFAERQQVYFLRKGALMPGDCQATRSQPLNHITGAFTVSARRSAWRGSAEARHRPCLAR